MTWQQRGKRKGPRKIPQALRNKVIARDRKSGVGCYFQFIDICLGIDGKVEVHHKIEAEDDGETVEENLATACVPCHRRWSARQSQKRAVAAGNEWKRKPEKHPGVLD